MRKKLSLFIKKKNKGMIQDIMPSIVIIIACAILMLMFVYILGMMQKCEEVRQVGRRYILVMETEGYLSDEQEKQMKKDLVSIGIAETDIFIDGDTTKSGVNYGKPVKLIFTCNIPTIRTSTEAEHPDEDLLNMVLRKTKVPYKVSMASTAKK